MKRVQWRNAILDRADPPQAAVVADVTDISGFWQGAWSATSSYRNASWNRRVTRSRRTSTESPGRKMMAVGVRGSCHYPRNYPQTRDYPARPPTSPEFQYLPDRRNQSRQEGPLSSPTRIYFY